MNILPVSDRTRAALITNHGYAGPNPPIGNAPDTGGQNVYVNDLAHALEDKGYEVFIFTRGGFPDHGTKTLREGEAMMAPHIRYVYIPGGGDRFIRKEEIATALGEQAEQLYGYVNELARVTGEKPWNVFDFINSHYWDAGVLGYDLVERWQADFIFEVIDQVFAERLKPEVLEKYRKERHIRAVRHNWHYLLGALAIKSGDVEIGLSDSPVDIHRKCISALTRLDSRFDSFSMTLLSRLKRAHWPVFTINKTTVASVLTGHLVADFLANIEALRPADIFRLNRHFWTPHSLGPIKELNFMDYDWSIKRDLRFVERRHEERVVCERTPLIVSTSKAVSNTLVANYNVHPDRIIYFPPCVNAAYRPREADACPKAYEYLSKKCGLSIEKLMQSKIVLEASRADRTKRKDLIVEGFREIAKAVPDAVLFVFGGPKNDVFAELEAARAAAPALADRIFLVPETVEADTLAEIFAAAALYVSASEMEGFGMSVLQAAACGVPVVSSDMVPFAVMHLKKVAEIVSTQSASAYAQAMARLLGADTADRKRLRDALVDAAADFTWKVRVDDLHTAEHEPTIIFAEDRLENRDIRLGEDRESELMVSAAHLHRGGRFIKDTERSTENKG